MRKSQLSYLSSACEHETPTTTAHTSQPTPNRKNLQQKKIELNFINSKKGAPETEIQEQKKNTSKGCGCPQKNLGGERNLGAGD
jgi:hypothetical protein